MSYNVHGPDNVGSVLQDLEARLRRLETATTTALVLSDPTGVKRVDVGHLANGEYGIQINPTTTDAGMSIDSSVPDLKVYDAAGATRVDVGLLSNGEYGLQVNPGITSSGMQIDSTVPAIKVFDGSGTQRVVIGNDASIPGNFGMRVNDASGNDIWDSEGLQLVTSLAGHGAGSPLGNIFSSADAALSGAPSVSFTAARAVSVLLVGFIAVVSGGSAYSTHVGIGLDGASPTSLDSYNNNDRTLTVMGMRLVSVAAGNHTAQWWGYADSGSGSYWANGLWAFQMGG